jgi:hypothetical protein
VESRAYPAEGGRAPRDDKADPSAQVKRAWPSRVASRPSTGCPEIDCPGRHAAPSFPPQKGEQVCIVLTSPTAGVRIALPVVRASCAVEPLP